MPDPILRLLHNLKITAFLLDTGTQDDGDLADENIELSDVIEVIETDPDFKESKEPAQHPTMFNGGGEIPVPQQTTAIQSGQLSSMSVKKQARIRIVEQPASKALRFRYECEGRSAGSIPGARSTPENKSYPTIRVEGYQGRAVVVVSCVTRDQPYRPHPYNLVSKANNKECGKGIISLNNVSIDGPHTLISFKNIGVQCVKRTSMAASLELRESLGVDPFLTGFSHRNQPTSIDLNVVRLCFQVFLEGDTPGKFSVTVPPVVSDPIYDKKAMSDLTIIKLSDCSSYVDGGRKDIILLCEKVAKEDIQVRFFEENGEWEAFADFQPSQVHKQHAIWFRTPRYKTLDVTDPVDVFIQLRRPSDGATSEALPFKLWPEPHSRKRQKMPDELVRQLQGDLAANTQFTANDFQIGNVKVEPRATPSPGYVGSLSPYSVGMAASPYEAVSPMYAPNILSPPLPQMQWNNAAPSAGPLPPMGAWNITSANLGGGDQFNSLQNLDSGEIVRLVDSQASLPNLDMSLSDIVPTDDTNMTDSITKLVNCRIDELTNLN
ncbi:embryonic polarity protein dorsal-like isoform X5 [Diabrotica undecimpunctata]|uniref:embryonic polarity protein dorsal-like isoform X5 n=1 Tax=Diabrotica undecimpunctata TaxID=50387 RepID=UPI003B640015